MKTSSVSRPDPVKRLKDLATKITDFINSNSNPITIQLSRLPENGGYTEIELTYPTANVDGGALTISDLNGSAQPIEVPLLTITYIDYSVNWLLLTFRSGECIKVVEAVDHA